MKALQKIEDHSPTGGNSLSLQFSITGLRWVAFKGPGHPSMERLGLCSSVAWRKEVRPLPSTAHSEKMGCWEQDFVFRAQPRTSGPPHPQPQGGYGPAGALTVTTTTSSQAASGARRAVAYLPPFGTLFLSGIKGKVSSIALAKAWFCLSVCPAEPAARFALYRFVCIHHSGTSSADPLTAKQIILLIIINADPCCSTPHCTSWPCRAVVCKPSPPPQLRFPWWAWSACNSWLIWDFCGINSITPLWNDNRCQSCYPSKWSLRVQLLPD